MDTKDAGKRIKQLLEYYEITASSFAERIQVQRSSISHILSGRNNPSLDLIYKIIDTFPEINPMWLIAGKGTMRQLDLFENKDVKETRHQAENIFDFDDEQDLQSETIVTQLPPKATIRKKRQIKKEEQTLQTSLPFVSDNEEKEIEKIMVFYKDKTFSVYKPE